MAVAGNTGGAGGARNLRAVARRQKRTSRPVPVPGPVDRALAQRAYFKSQGASVAKQAYLAAPVPQRRSQVRQARKEQRARLASASKVLANTGSHEKAWQAYQRGAQPETSQILGIHGFRASAPARAGRERRDIRARYNDTSAVRPTNVMPSTGFEGFGKEQARRQQLTPAQAKKDPKIKQQVVKEAAAAKAGLLTPPWLKGAKAGTLFAMEQLLRPSSALGAAQLNRSAKGGSSIGSRFHAAVKGFEHPDQHAGDWVKAAKAQHWPVPVVSGTAASIAADPTTYLGLGAGSVAKEAALKAYGDALGQGLARHEAVAAARKVWEEAPAHAKVPGIKLRVNAGVPFSRKLRVNLATAPTKLQGRVVQGARKAGISTHAPLANAARRAVRAVAPGVRPVGMDPLDWAFVRRAGTEGRAGERAAQRHAEHRLHAYHQLAKDLPADRQMAIRIALQDTPHVAGQSERKAVFAAHGLNETEQKIGHEMATERARQYALEPDRVPLTADSRVGFAEPPRAPRIAPADVKATRAEVEAARRAVLASAHHVGRIVGKDPVLADIRRYVQQTAAAVKSTRSKLDQELGRRAATEQRIGPQAHESLGTTVARQRHEAAVAEHNAAKRLQREHKVRLTSSARADFRESAAQRLKDAEKLHAAEVQTAKTGRKQYRMHIKDVQAYLRAPKGYVHTPLRPEVLTPEAGARQSTGRGARVGSFSYQSQRGGKLADMAPDALANRELRIPVSQAHRALEHGRIVNAQNVNDWIASLGRPITHADAAQHVGAQMRIFGQDSRGFTPIFDKYGKVDSAKLAAAHRAGQQLRIVDPGIDDTIRQLSRGNRNPRVRDAALALTGEKDQQGIGDRALRGWKYGATQINPSYWIRNFLGDSYNATLAGTVASDFVASARILRQHGQARKLERILQSATDPKKLAQLKSEGKVEAYGRMGQLSDTQVAALAAKHGAIDTGILQAELAAAREGADIGDQGIRHRIAASMGRANDARENIVRLATFRGALKRGMTPDEAAQWSLAHHFDYSELSHGEQTYARRVFPFWTFMARNTPLQIKTLATHPAIPATVEKLRRGTLQAAGLQQNASTGMEPFEQTNLPWGTPFKYGGSPITAAPGFSNMDLSNIPLGIHRAQIEQAAGNVLGRSNPLLSTGLVGIGFGKNPLNMQDLPQYVPMPSAWPKDAPGPLKPHLVRPEVLHLQGTKPVWAITGRAALLANVLPVSAVAAKIGTGRRPGQPTAAALRGASWALGPRIAVENPHQRRINQLFDRIDQINNEVKRLEPRALEHTSGKKWGGKVGRLLNESAQKQVEIYRESKAMGADHPLGRPPGHGRRKKAALPGGFKGTFKLNTGKGGIAGGFGQ